MRGRGTSVCLHSQRQFHPMHLDRIFCTSPIIKEQRRRGRKRTANKSSSLHSLLRWADPTKHRLLPKPCLSWPRAGWLGGPMGGLAPISLAPATPPLSNVGIDFLRLGAASFSATFWPLFVLLRVTWLGKISLYCCGRGCAPLQLCILLSPHKFHPQNLVLHCNSCVPLSPHKHHSQNLDLLWASPSWRVW